VAKNILLNVLLPKEREKAGWLRVEIERVPVAEIRVLGRGSTTGVIDGKPFRNPTLTPLGKGGNTPTGDYVSPGIERTPPKDEIKYGPWGKVVLKPMQGQAIKAEKAGRGGFLIHGGGPPKKGSGNFDGLRSTYGCLRVSDADMFRLMMLLFDAQEDRGKLQSVPIEVQVHVRDY
jgi:hypothetical protein